MIVISPLEAAIVLSNDSGPFSAAPEMDGKTIGMDFCDNEVFQQSVIDAD